MIKQSCINCKYLLLMSDEDKVVVGVCTNPPTTVQLLYGQQPMVYHKSKYTMRDFGEENGCINFKPKGGI